MENQKRDRYLHIKISEEERSLIGEKMKLAGILNLSAYIRKMAIDGYVVRVNLEELREILSLLRYIRQRQAEGIAAAKKRGVQFGRPTIEAPDNFDELVKRWMHQEISVKDILHTCNMSESTFYRRLREYRARHQQRK